MKSFCVSFSMFSFIRKKPWIGNFGGKLSTFRLYNTYGTYERLDKISEPKLTLHESGILYRKFSAAFGNQLRMILRKERKNSMRSLDNTYELRLKFISKDIKYIYPYVWDCFQTVTTGRSPTENSTTLQLAAKEIGWDEGNKNRNFFI